ncbi:hypothetical protein BDV10DRAFT_19525 [Aspergillus recurvatus]
MDFVQTDTLSVRDLLRSGKPFVPFSEFSIQALLVEPDEHASRWVEDKLRDGRPFVIRGFAQTDAWRTAPLNNESLVKLSASGAIPVRNCHTGRDVRMRLRDLFSHSNHASAAGVQESLYAKDLHCPEEWVRAFETILPSSLRYLGSLDLFRALPKETAPEVLMAYVGTRKSFSGFHRCFSATVALNLLIESEGNGLGSICFGTDRNSQERYDAFMEGLGKSAHTDWANMPVNKLRSADFPIYITDQGPGDLVVFPAATAHQVWNVSPMVTKVVWNIMHATSVASFFDHVQPAYQKQCHADTGRVSLIPMYALQSGACRSEDESLLLNIFHQQVEDEITGRKSFNSLGVANHLTKDDAAQRSLLSIKTVDTQGAVVECNFCGLTIWNRHLHCEKCGDFDLCLTCFVSGRSCKHTTDYTWAEILPQQRCQDIIKVARSSLGSQSPQLSRPSKQKSLGLVAAAAMDARQQSAERLCHLCRDSHPAWKGTTCSQCSAFFCFRGLHRHFDVDLIPFLRNPEDWICPKCKQVCNCRCCHFHQPYRSKDKPVRVRVKSIDARGRILGFVDNVFDQKRGKRASQTTSSTLPQQQHSPRGLKRSKLHTDEEPRQPWQHTRSSAVARAEPCQTRRLGTFDSPSINIPTPVSNNLNDTPARAFDPLAPFRHENQVEPAPESHSAQYAYLPPPTTVAATPDESVSRRHIERNCNEGDTADNESIQELENKLRALRGYADDALELSLMESHAKILDRISQVEAEIERQKRRKAELLFSRLNKDFPDLADLAREEARRRGL